MPLNVPLPDPSGILPQTPPASLPSAEPDGITKALPIITALFSLGTALGGSPRAGAAFLHGAHQTLTAQKQERELKAKEAAQRALDQQKLQAADAIRQQQVERRRQLDIQGLIGKTQESLKGVTDKSVYEQTIDAAERMGQAFYGLRPNTIRALVPYRAPNAQKNLYDAVDKYLKNPANQEAIKSGKVLNAAIQVDTDGDGLPDRPVPLAQAIQESGYPVFIDPETKKPILTEKPVKPENVEPFDLAFRGLVDAFKTDKGRDPTDKEKGAMAVQAQRSLDKPTAAPSGLAPNILTRVNGVSTAFGSDPIVKRANTIGEAVSFVNSLDPKTSNPADDQALIYAFAKAMDPESVVREGEYATVQKYAQSWLESFGFNAARVVSNKEFLTPQARANMKATILKKYQAAKALYDNARKGYGRRINALSGGQANPDDYLVDYGAALPDPMTGTAPAKPTPNAAPQIAVGQVVTVRGKKVKVTKVNADGTYEGTIVR